MKPSLTLLALTLSAALAACGRSEPPAAEAPAAEEQERAGAAQQAPAAEAAAPAAEAAAAPAQPSRPELAVEDIARWQRGLAAELQAVQQAATRLAEAQDERARLEALAGSLESNTLDAGAAAAGVDRDSYRRIRATLSDAVAQLSPLSMEMDLSKMPPEVARQMQQAREQSAAELGRRLPPELLEALRAQAAQLRAQDQALVAERLKLARSAR